MKDKKLSHKTQKILLLVFGIHLFISALGSMKLFPRLKGIPGELLTMYGSYTGASNQYGFFAPGVGTHLRSRIEIYDTNGKKFQYFMTDGKNEETALRIGNIIDAFWLAEEDKSLRRSMAASWAGKAFALYPKASNITINVESYDLPNMKFSRKGAKPRWVNFYTANFKKATKNESI